VVDVTCRSFDPAWLHDNPADACVEDLGYELGWVALGEPGIDDDGCEAARAMGAAIVASPEMQAIKAVLAEMASSVGSVLSRPELNGGHPIATVDVLRLYGLPEVVVEWVMS
jgi:hypothetical protein